ncbi:MAG: hypothetical protein KGY80_10535 [Candidatus Thorarchaeota archaeon]|nr:hypothetical protein [Candidatus Thorarchaeota archaeon]
MRVYLDANFFISGFSERPKDVAHIQEAAEKAGMELWITRQVFHELRWYLRREVEEIIRIDETLSKDIKKFIAKIGWPKKALPQFNDMSLILAASRADEAKIVTSDMKLLNTIEDLSSDIDDIESVEGIVGSAFVLELIESVDEDKLDKTLRTIRDRIYSEEVRYSISRRKSYDPVTRIRIIEDHALRVIRSVKRPAEDVDKKLSEGQPLFVLDFLEDIKAGLPAMFEDFQKGMYDSLANEIEAIQNEIERLLIVSTLTQDSATHDRLVDHASDLTLFLYYLEMICHLYRGTREGVEDALVVSDEAARLLMFASISNNELKASVFMVIIILNLIQEDYEEIDYYYSLYDGLLDRAGLTQMQETSEGLYVTMQILREFMGGFKLTKTKLEHPSVTISMLNDIATYCIQFDNHDNAWHLALNGYKIGVAYGKEQGALTSFHMLYKVSASSHDRFKGPLEKIAEHALKTFVKKGWSTEKITPILHETQGNLPEVEDMSTDGFVRLEELPEEMTVWMDVLSREGIDGNEVLIVRNDELQARVGIDIREHKEIRALRTGHKIALSKGEFKIEQTSGELKGNHAVVFLITPGEGAEVSFEGEYGFRYLEIAQPQT